MGDLSYVLTDPSDGELLMLTFESTIKARLKELGVKYLSYDDSMIIFEHPAGTMCTIKFMAKKKK